MRKLFGVCWVSTTQTANICAIISIGVDESKKNTHRCVIGVEVPLVKMLQHNYIDKKIKQHVKQISVQRTQLLLHVHINIIVVRLLSESI